MIEEIADLDYRTELLGAEQRGKIRGEMRNKLQTALKMLLTGVPIEDIKRFADLSENDIRLLDRTFYP